MTYVKNQTDAEAVFLANNCIVIGGVYTNSYSKLDYVCHCGYVGSIHTNGFKKGKRCGYCNRKTYLEDIEQRRESLFNFGIKYTHSLEFRCTCGSIEYLPHIHSRIFNTYICPKCDIRKTRHSSEYNNWKFAVRLRYNDKCQCCNSLDKPHAHHIKSRQAYPELQYIIDNGIVLCFECHMQLHMFYGSETTEIQLAEFIQKKLVLSKLC